MRTNKRIAIFGLGYVGLPLVRSCVEAGHAVVGMEVDEEKVARLNRGMTQVDDVTEMEVSDWLNRGFTPTTDFHSLTDIDVFVICVPTPLSKAGGPDLSAVEASARTISAALEFASTKPLVVLESTTYPGTTEEVVLPILEESGMTAGIDFCLAFSPERIDPGNKSWNFKNTPKVVGGLTAECADAAEAFYSDLTSEVIRSKGLKAEMTKLLENTYRHVNIALVNEFAKICDELGIDVWDVIRAAETKPYGFQAFRPGPGVGGHCIPIDPNYLSHRVKVELGQSFRFIELAQEINASMPKYVVSRVQALLNGKAVALQGSRILILGVTYKSDVSDVRESPSVPVIRELRHFGAEVTYHDPYVDSLSVDGITVPRSMNLAEDASLAACTVLLQGHAVYADSNLEASARLLLDTRDFLTSSRRGVEGSWAAL